MQWPSDTQLHQMVVVAAPYGGPMAIVRDSKQFIKVGGSTVKPVIRIFTAAGNQLAAINVSMKTKIISCVSKNESEELFFLLFSYCSGTAVIC